MMVRRGLVSLAVCCSVFLTMLVAAAPRAHATLDTVIGGQSKLFVSLATVQRLNSDRIISFPNGGAYITFVSTEGPAVVFPISDGLVESDTMLGTVNHPGGLTLQKVDENFQPVTELQITEIKIFNGNTLLGNTQGVLPAPAGDLINISFSKHRPSGVISYEADVQVSETNALVLNTYFNTTVFEAGMILGHLKSSIQTPVEYYARPRGADPLRTQLTVAYEPCNPGSADKQHGAPLDVPSCTPAQASDHLTVGTLDANGLQAKAVGSVSYDVRPGIAATPADEADVGIAVAIRDVRAKSDLSDYTGELQVTTSRRITDKDNTPSTSGATGAGTTQDTPLSITVPCAGTADETIGSLCEVSTTADAVVPGQVKENMRSNWELGQVKVFDGGTDSDADTALDNTLFMDQGIFVP
jgi:hypothetical protein